MDAVNSGAQDWYSHINELYDESNKTDEDKLQHAIKLIQLVRTDIQKSRETYDPLFQQ